MALKQYLGPEAQAYVDELLNQQRRIYCELADILGRETAGKELTPLEQQELRALQMIAQNITSGALEQFIADDPQGVKEVAASTSSTIINKLADHEAGETEGTH